MSPDRQRLAILAILQDFKAPGQSDLDAAIDRILAQRGEIESLRRQLAEARKGAPSVVGGSSACETLSVTAVTARADKPERLVGRVGGRPATKSGWRDSQRLRVIRGGAA